MLMLHRALLKVLQIFFDNFQSDFRGQELTSNVQILDVDDNTEILQFEVSALYQLQPTWLNKYVCIYSRTQTQSFWYVYVHTYSTDTQISVHRYKWWPHPL